MNVAEHVIEKCGGAAKVAEMLGVHITRVYRWTYDEGRGGTGGRIPGKRQEELLKLAKEKGIELEPADFFPRAAA